MPIGSPLFSRRRRFQADRNRTRFTQFTVLLLTSALSGAWLWSESPGNLRSTNRAEKILAIVHALGARLGISEQISVVIVPEDKRLVSVRRSKEQRNTFLITFDENFLLLLNEEELRAAIAHELGHIWIFTHHPFLQTEALANQKAMEVVSAESLQQVYLKVSRFRDDRQALRPPTVPVQMTPAADNSAAISAAY